MKYILPFFHLIFVTVAYGQQIDVRATGSSSQNDIHTYQLETVQIQLADDNLVIRNQNVTSREPLPVVMDVSPGLALLNSVVADGNLTSVLVDGRGVKIREMPLEYFDAEDNTIEVRQFDDGRFIIRDNVANFTLFNTDGTVQYNILNSSQSLDGESVSGIVTGRYGRTVVVYNPMIRYGEQIGSRARIVEGENDFLDLYFSNERVIKYAYVSESGTYIVLITGQEGEDDIVRLYDRFGNGLGEIVSEEDLIGANMTTDADYLTVYSTGRAQVYRVSDLERIGSTSIQSPVLHAGYQPDDDQIIILTGVLSEDRHLAEPRVYSVHIGERQIARTDVNFPLSTLSIEQIGIERIGTGHYLITGLNRQLEATTEF